MHKLVAHCNMNLVEWRRLCGRVRELPEPEEPADDHEIFGWQGGSHLSENDILIAELEHARLKFMRYVNNYVAILGVGQDLEALARAVNTTLQERKVTCVHKELL